MRHITRRRNTPQKLEEVVQLARDLGINTIYSEDLDRSASTNTIAQEIPNGKVVILSPIEGIIDQSKKMALHTR